MDHSYTTNVQVFIYIIDYLQVKLITNAAAVNATQCNTSQISSSICPIFPVFQSLSRPISQNIPPKKKEGHLLLLPSKSPAKYAAGDSKRSGNGLKEGFSPTACPSWSALLVSMGGKLWGCFSNPDEWSHRPKSARGYITWHDRLQLYSWKSDRKLCFSCLTSVFVAIFCWMQFWEM